LMYLLAARRGARRSSLATRGPQRPSIVETIVRSSTLASRGRVDQQRLLATLAVVPELDGVGLLDFNRFDSIVDVGRRAAERALLRVPSAIGRQA
jgi:predicted acylesterase/phospholipase RssA